MINKKEEIQKLVSELEEKGKVNLLGKGLLECRNDRIIFSNPYNLSIGTKTLKSDQVLKILDDYIDYKIEKMNRPKDDAESKRNYKPGNNTLAALKKKVS